MARVVCAGDILTRAHGDRDSAEPRALRQGIQPPGPPLLRRLAWPRHLRKRRHHRPSQSRRHRGVGHANVVPSRSIRLANYHRIFVFRFSAAPLTAHRGLRARHTWGPAEQQLTSTPALRVWDLAPPTRVLTDGPSGPTPQSSQSLSIVTILEQPDDAAEFRLSPLGRGKLGCSGCSISPTQLPSGALATRAAARAFSFRDGLFLSLSPCGDRLSAPSAGAKVLLAVVIRRAGPACWRSTVLCRTATILQISTPESATPTTSRAKRVRAAAADTV